MGSNKFATMLYRNKTPKIAIVLIYTLLEWTLIVLLLLNAFFYFLIDKFANFFGLKPPCIFCSRVDHLFGPKKSYKDLMCDAHAKDVSKYGFCSNHNNLAEASEMCEDCMSSKPLDMTVLSWMKRIEEGENDLRCSCCKVVLESGFYSAFFAAKPSTLCDYVKEEEEDLDVCDDDSNENHDVVKEVDVEKDRGIEVDCNVVKIVDDESIDLLASMENVVLSDVDRLVPIEVIDFATLIPNDVEEDEDDDRDYVGYSLVNKDDIALVIGNVLEEERLVSNELVEASDKSVDSNSIDDESLLSNELVEASDKSVDSNSIDDDRDYVGYNLLEKNDTSSGIGIVLEEERLVSNELVDASNFIENSNISLVEEEKEEEEEEEEEDKSTLLLANHDIKSQAFDSVDDIDVELPLIDFQSMAPQPNLILKDHSEGFGAFQDSKEESKVMDAEVNYEVSIGSDICDQEHIDLPQANDIVHHHLPNDNEQSSSGYNVITNEEKGIEDELVEYATSRSIPTLSICTKHNEIDQEKISETPTSLESLHTLHKRLFLLDRRESGTETLDGSITKHNEIEEEKIPETPTSLDGLHTLHKRLFLLDRRESGTESLDGSITSELDGNEVLTVEHLKTSLKALYIELEEERSASAIAANQTMAMITRLQEEKSAMQMEALQYQRMMDEQSEYDQEAMQLLNELMSKKEKEKQELENELEVCRKKLCYYETKERRASSATSSNDESDDLSFESREEEKCNYFNSERNYDSLNDFEEERLMILDQLKALEKKLFMADDDEPNSHGLLSNGVHEYIDSSNDKMHYQRKALVSGGRRLLPLFDATVDMENEDELDSNHVIANGNSNLNMKFVLDDEKRAEIAEEVDNLYERIHALEEDREFIKHCIRSLKNGDKGVDLLREILQHLRDLRSVELRVRNEGDALASLSS